VGLITLVAMIVGVVLMYWPSSADPNSSDMNERLIVVSEKVGSSDKEDLDILVKLAGDAELRVAKAAIRAIGSRSDEASRLELERIATKNENGELRGTAAAEVGKFQKTDYRLLTGILLDDKDPKARRGAARGLKRLHNAAAMKSLVKALGDTDCDTRRNSFEAIGAATAIRLQFNAMASLDTRNKQIAEIKRRLEMIKKVHHHDH
jgi:HEAT repeat protein